MNEVDKFQDYKGRSFDQLLKDILGKDEYDKFYCLIEGAHD